MYHLHSKTVYPVPEYLIEQYETIDIEVVSIMNEVEEQYRLL